MRTWGRIFPRDGNGAIIRGSVGVWTEVQTAPNGSNSMVYVTALIQVLQGILNESPFYAQYGIPAQQAVIQQFFPDVYMWRTQAQFSQYFASLIITRSVAADGVTPVYNVAIITNEGQPIYSSVAAVAT
jgi:hypothetical protein